MRLPWRWIVGGLVAMAAGVWMVALWLPAWLAPAPVERSPVEGEAPVAAPAQESRRITATLFYVAGTGDALVPVTREVPYAQSPALQARRIVEAQLGPAPSGRVTAVPQGATVRALFLTSRGEAYVDIGGALAANHPGGSLHEALTVYTIVNALTINLPDIEAVQILIDGREVDTLAGHIDLRHPLRRAQRWITQ